jgi:hypothetical protein
MNDHEYIRTDSGDVDLSILAIVGRDRFALAGEFERWFETHHQFLEPAAEGLRRWEVERFGGQLYASAHGVLWFVVRRNLRPADQAAPRRVQAPADETAARFQKAFVNLVDGKAMSSRHGG